MPRLLRASFFSSNYAVFPFCFPSASFYTLDLCLTSLLLALFPGSFVKRECPIMSYSKLDSSFFCFFHVVFSWAMHLFSSSLFSFLAASGSVGRQRRSGIQSCIRERERRVRFVKREELKKATLINEKNTKLRLRDAACAASSTVYTFSADQNVG